MPRKPRQQAPGLRHHVVHRGICKQTIFFDDYDRKKFLQLLQRAANRYAVSIYAFCLMRNHYHLFVHDADGCLSAFQQFVAGGFTTYVNLRHERDGALLRGRFFSSPVYEDRYALALMRYIHLNPVSAHVVPSAELSLWSSFCSYTQNRWDTLVDTGPMRRLWQHLGIDMTQLLAWTQDPNTNFHLAPSTMVQLTRVMSDHDMDKGAVPGDRIDEFRAIIDRIAKAHGIDASCLTGANLATGRRARAAKSMALALCQEQAGASYQELAATFHLKLMNVNGCLRRGRELWARHKALRPPS